MSVGPIPWKTIVEYGLYAGLDQDMIAPFVHIIRSMDAAFLEWNQKEMDRKTKSGEIGNRVKKR